MFKIIVPLTYQELHRLKDISRLWEATILPNEHKLISKIVFSFDNISNEFQECEKVCLTMFQKFGTVEIFDSKLSEAENIYVRNPSSVQNDMNIPKFGYKSGPNSQFFRTIRANLSYNLFSWAFYCETDCYPLTSKWISRLYQACLFNKNAIILGSLYHGAARLGKEINFHINGNALYNLSKFSQAEAFYGLLENFILLEVAQNNKNIAYDVAFETLKHKIVLKDDRNKLFKHLQTTDQEVRILASKVRPIDFIVNKAGSDELNSAISPTLEDVHELINTGAVLVHSPRYLDSIKIKLLQSDTKTTTKVYDKSVEYLLSEIRANQNKDFSVSWSFLLHEELMQKCISEKYILKGYLCNTLYSNKVSEEVEFIHVQSKLLTDCFDAKHDISVVVASLFCKKDTNSFFLLVSSGKTHQRIFIDLQKHSAWFSQVKWQDNIVKDLERCKSLLRSLLEIEKIFISRNSCNCVTILPLSTRPFLTVNDYSVFIRKLIDNEKHICLIFTGRYTFLDYSEPTLLDCKYISRLQATSVDHINSSIHDLSSWLIVPRSVSYKKSNPFTWLHQVKKTSLKNASVNSLRIFKAIKCKKLYEHANYLENQRFDFVFLIDIAQEKRYCRNLASSFIDFLQRLSCFKDKNKNLTICVLLDGYTMSDSANDDFLSCEKRFTEIINFENIFGSLPQYWRSALSIFTLHGLSVNQKVRVIPSNSIGICQMGTASLLYSYVYNLKTFIIGPPAVLSKSSPAFYEEQNSYIVDSSSSVVFNSDISKPWDRQRYEIGALDAKLIAFMECLQHHAEL